MGGVPAGGGCIETWSGRSCTVDALRLEALTHFRCMSFGRRELLSWVPHVAQESGHHSHNGGESDWLGAFAAPARCSTPVTSRIIIRSESKSPRHDQQTSKEGESPSIDAAAPLLQASTAPLARSHHLVGHPRGALPVWGTVGAGAKSP